MTQFRSSTFVSPSTKRELFYLIAGPTDGPLMVLLHGWPGSALTWKYQLESFGSLGFYVVAPDMPGYGKSWSSSNSSDFALQNLVPQFIEFLHHLGRDKAIWFGHDWGCGILWNIAAHHPEVCEAVIGMSVPYRSIEVGLNKVLATIDRELYPESKYPAGQWDYQLYYEQDPKAANQFLESNITNHVKLMFSKGSEAVGRGVGRTAEVRKNRGWFGGLEHPAADLPIEKSVLDEELLNDVVAGLTRHGFWGGTSWYLNHKANKEYAGDGSVLELPVLFIHTEYDAVCQTTYNPRSMKDMREKCKDLQEFTLKTAHWGMLERPNETNSGIVRWILETASHLYPGPQPSTVPVSG